MFSGIGADPNFQVGNTIVRKTGTITSGNVLGSYQFNGTLDGYANGPYSGAEIQGVADGSWVNTTSSPGKLLFYVVPSGSTTPVLGMTVKSNGAVAISNADPAASAQLDIVSTTKGLLPPRMTNAQANAISSPATGLTVYCTDCTALDASTGVLEVWNGSAFKKCW